MISLDIRYAKAAVGVTDTSALSRGGWVRIVGRIAESFAGAWQRNIEVDTESVLTFAAVYSCITLISSDIGKVRIKLVEEDKNGICTEVESPSFSPVLRKPNHYQTRNRFIEQWMTSKLIAGNAYILKERDDRGVVVAMYVLDPSRVRVLVAPDGSVYYGLNVDMLSGLTEGIIAPASEIIHDIMPGAFNHPLCGVSPITACGLAAMQGLKIQANSYNLFANGSQPGGILTTNQPGEIDKEDKKRIADEWERAFGGNNAGRVAVLGSSMTYAPLAMDAVDSQLVEQLRMTAEQACTAFHTPGYLVGVGPAPNYSNVEALSQQYYSQCLQTHFESIESLLDDGLGLTKPGSMYGTEFDLDGLLRMDTATLVKAAADAIGAGAMTPNEARKKYFGLKPVAGGDACYLQQQDFSLAALAKRDAQADPFESSRLTSQQPAALPAAPEPDDDETPADADKLFEVAFRRELAA